MSLVRGALAIIVAFVLTVSLSSSIVFSNLVYATQPENVKGAIADYLYERMQSDAGNEMTEGILEIKTECETRESVERVVENATVSINCSDIKNLDDKSLVRYIISKVIDSVSEAKGCGGLCIGNPGDPIYSITSERQNMENLRNYSIIASIASVATLLFLSETWKSRFRRIGQIMLVVGVPLTVIFYIGLPILGNTLPYDLGSGIDLLIDRLFGPFKMIYLGVTAAGAALVIASFFIDRPGKDEKKS